MSRPNQDTDKRVMERIKQQSADEHAKYMAEKMLSEKRQTIVDENHFLKGRIEELEAQLAEVAELRDYCAEMLVTNRTEANIHFVADIQLRLDAILKAGDANE